MACILHVSFVNSDNDWWSSNWADLQNEYITLDIDAACMYTPSMPNKLVTDQCITTYTFQEFRPSISIKRNLNNPHKIIHSNSQLMFSYRRNWERNELRIMHYLIAFTYGQPEQSNHIFSYMADQTMWGINQNTKTIDLMHLESRAVKSFSQMADQSTQCYWWMNECICFYHTKQ